MYALQCVDGYYATTLREFADRDAAAAWARAYIAGRKYRILAFEDDDQFDGADILCACGGALIHFAINRIEDDANVD
jgi:hypothetical protein